MFPFVLLPLLLPVGVSRLQTMTTGQPRTSYHCPINSRFLTKVAFRTKHLRMIPTPTCRHRLRMSSSPTHLPIALLIKPIHLLLITITTRSPTPADFPASNPILSELFELHLCARLVYFVLIVFNQYLINIFNHVYLN